MKGVPSVSVVRFQLLSIRTKRYGTRNVTNIRKDLRRMEMRFGSVKTVTLTVEQRARNHAVITGEHWEYSIDGDNAMLSIADVDTDDNGQPMQTLLEFASMEIYDQTENNVELHEDLCERRLALMAGAPELHHALEHVIERLVAGDTREDIAKYIQFELFSALPHNERERVQALAYWDDNVEC